MSRKTKAKLTTKEEAKLTTKEERHELLQRLWAAHTRKLVEKLETSPAGDIDAATFNAAAKLLSDNGVTFEALNQNDKQPGKDLSQAARLLPQFEDPVTDDLRQSLCKPLPQPVWSEEARTSLKRLEDKD